MFKYLRCFCFTQQPLDNRPNHPTLSLRNSPPSSSCTSGSIKLLDAIMVHCPEQQVFIPIFPPFARTLLIYLYQFRCPYVPNILVLDANPLLLLGLHASYYLKMAQIERGREGCRGCGMAREFRWVVLDGRTSCWGAIFWKRDVCS